jgi:large subunit ribosomal protein L35
MPKMKTNSSAKKRFKVKKNGTVARGSAFRSHILSKMTKKRKRALRSAQTIASNNVSSVKRMLNQA